MTLKLLRRVVAELDSRRERIAVALSAENGKPIAEARGETGAAIDQFDWYADEAQARRNYDHTLERRTLSLNQENISDHGIHFWLEVIRDAEALFA